MKANVHFIPFEKDASDVLEKLEWAKRNDEQAKQIAKDGTKLAQDLLTPENMYCYYAMALYKYR